ncbi:MAG: prohibitin family protein [Candidatus Magasanikbacteria bacterium]
MKEDLKERAKELKDNNPTWMIFIAIFILFLIPFVGSFWTTVEAGHVGVKSFFGNVYDEELSSGFHFKNPLIQVIPMSIRTQEYTMSATRGEGAKYSEDSITALTKEGLEVDLDITVLFHLQEGQASEVYSELGADYVEKVIRPTIRSVIRENIANYQAKTLYSKKREEAKRVIYEKLDNALEPRGITVEDVLLRNVKLPKDLSRSIEKKLQAEQDAERYNYLLEKEKKEAKRKRIEAKGQRDAQQIINQGLTNRYLKYQYIKNLKEREGTIYVPTNPSNGVPLFRGL